MKRSKLLTAVVCLALSAVFSTRIAQAQKDPGPRGGPPGAGGPGSFYPTLNANEQDFFQPGALALPGSELGVGKDRARNTAWGPHSMAIAARCAMPNPQLAGAVLAWPARRIRFRIPQVALATLDGATNVVPSFITPNGPVREARFIRNSDGSLGWWGSRFVHHRGPLGCSRLHACAAKLRPTTCFQQCDFPHPNPAVRLGPGREHARCHFADEPGRDSSRPVPAWYRRHFQHQRQRWDDHAFRLEGAEQVAADLRRRGL